MEEYLSIKSSTGQTLIEVLIALSIAAVVTSSLAYIIVVSLRNAQYSRDQNQATHYAQQGVEILRQMRQNDIVFFTSLVEPNIVRKYCLAKDSLILTDADRTLQNECSQNVDIFSRQVTLILNESPCKTEEVKASVIVSWSDSSCVSQAAVFCHKVTLDSCLNISPSVKSP